jgi:hypothetical protein
MNCNSPKKWEYLHSIVRVESRYGMPEFFVEGSTYSYLTTYLDEKGLEGWELVAVVDSGYIFKRELES